MRKRLDVETGRPTAQWCPPVDRQAGNKRIGNEIYLFIYLICCFAFRFELPKRRKDLFVLKGRITDKVTVEVIAETKLSGYFALCSFIE